MQRTLGAVSPPRSEVRHDPPTEQGTYDAWAPCSAANDGWRAQIFERSGGPLSFDRSLAGEAQFHHVAHPKRQTVRSTVKLDKGGNRVPSGWARGGATAKIGNVVRRVRAECAGPGGDDVCRAQAPFGGVRKIQRTSRGRSGAGGPP